MFNILDEIKQKQTKENQCQQRNDTSMARTIQFESMHIEKISNIKDLCGRIPSHNEFMMLWTLNSFNAFTFIVYAIKHIGTIKELTFSTYSLNERILSSLCRWYDAGEIQSVNILISDSIRHRTPKIYDLLCSQSSTRNINVSYAWNHSKVILMDVGGNNLVVEGSGNFSENALNEQYIFLNNKQAYDFRKQCLGGTGQG